MHRLLYNQNILLCVFCWIFVLHSCKPTEQTSSIPAIEADVMSDAKLKLSEYFENFRILQLQTDSVIGEIERIKYENNRIYVSDKYSLFVFSDDGELLSCLRKRGKGPGEYTRIMDFMVDGETITVLDRSQQRLLVYDHLGKSITTRSLGYFAQAISPAVGNSFFLYFFDTSFSHKLRRVRNGQEDSAYLDVDKNQIKYLLMFSAQNFYKYQESVYFFHPFNNTVYKSVGGNGIKSSFYVDFKGKDIPASFFRQFNDAGLFFNELSKTSYAFGVNNFALYDRFLMFNSYYQGNHKLTVFDRENKISNTFVSIKDDIYFSNLTIPVSEFKYQASDRIFVPLDASLVYEWKNSHAPTDQFKTVINATKEEDNPLLLIFDFKK